MDFAKLKDPFFPDELEWKPQSVGKSKGGKFWVKSLAYVTNRAIMDRLDAVVGPQAWKNEYKTGPEGGVLCGLSIKIGEEWVTKWDGSENTDIEAVKGGLSGAMKRAGVQWGIGRYLYDLDETFGEVREDGIFSAKTKEGEWFKWSPPKLPAWAIPGTNTTKVRGAAPPPSEPVEGAPPGPQQPPIETDLYRLKDFLNENKDKFTPDQAAIIRKDLASAGTTKALLDALRAKAEGYISANDKATREAFEAGGFIPE
jgi:hypothetical protein